LTCYLFARHTSTGSGLLDFSGYAGYVAGAAVLVLSRFDSGSETTLNFDFGGYSAGDVIRLECEGTTIRLLKNDVEIFSETDATYSSGKCALATESTSGGWDNLVVEHVAAAAINVDLAATLPALQAAATLQAPAAVTFAATLPTLQGAATLQAPPLADSFVAVRGLTGLVPQARGLGNYSTPVRGSGRLFVPVRQEA
jgi:hypothetical protein